MKFGGLLGRKLAHSYSPAIHEELGDYKYSLFEAEPEGLGDFLQNISKRQGFLGLNVTIPYKQTVIPFCRELSPAAAAIGSVNTLLPLPDGGLYGDNTDAVGFLAMARASGIEVKGKKILVLGGGGSSRTVCHVLKQSGAGEVIVISRNGQDNYDNLHKHEDAAVIVNTTPVGMYPDTESSPVSPALFPSLEGVLDLVYNPARTRLLTETEARGVTRLGGLIMLVEQAAAASALFTGKTPDAEKKQAVLDRLHSQMQNIILIGMPGCGKSIVGQLLAETTDRRFIDADKALEEAAGRCIPEIFESEGEAGFRARETDILRQWCKQSGLVIATGGGCVTRKENRFLLRQNGVVIFLERELSLLERKGRPLSQGDMNAMYEKRLPLYNSFADFTVRNDAEPDITVKNLLRHCCGFPELGLY
ncbi:MAG: shikimate kinase [Defluviitaleaceae bacterium]|nr:shikimate kinase [Defluviitaleaceae bacterium]